MKYPINEDARNEKNAKYITPKENAVSLNINGKKKLSMTAPQPTANPIFR